MQVFREKQPLIQAIQKIKSTYRMAASVLIVERNEKIGALVAGQLREKGYEAADELAVHWDLPAEVRTAIGAHHAPGSSNQHKRLAAMVHISDIAVRTMKIGFAGDDLIPNLLAIRNDIKLFFHLTGEI